MVFSREKFMVLLTDSGMSIKKFSEKSGVSNVSLGKILNHGTQPRLETIGKLARGLNVSSEQLMTDS